MLRIAIACAKAGTLIENKPFGFWGAPKAPLNLNRDQKIMAEFKECGGNQPPVWEEKGSVVATLNLNRSQVTKAETKKPGDVEVDFVNVVIEADDSYEKVDMYEAEMSEWEDI